MEIKWILVIGIIIGVIAVFLIAEAIAWLSLSNKTT